MTRTANNNSRSGAALLITLFIVMAIVVISLGFLNNSSTQLRIGNNFAMRGRIDYLAQSALTHAKTLITNPQDADTSAVGYWQGDTDLQIEAGDDYYDVTVTRASGGATPRCTYDIECQAYRQQGGENIVRSNLSARLRLDPCIGLWVSANTTIPASVTVNGDMRCGGDVTNNGTINGDVFADSITTSAAGQLYPAGDVQVTFPAMNISYFAPNYYIGSNFYASDAISDCDNVTFTPGGGNTAGVLYCNGDLTLSGNVSITGTLVVNGDLTITGVGNTITADKNFPAIIVNGNIDIDNGGTLSVTGLVQTASMSVSDTAANVTIVGGLFVGTGTLTVTPGYTGSIQITAGPVVGSLKTYTASEVYTKWTPIGDAFFKYIRRQ
ncbi:MAG TPA: hypothetical protein ENH94_10840 [Phycisphaerales bacterium]|nr:hypothetical protein [Phycisphaerales bacterium]